MSHSRKKKKQQQPPARDYRSMLSGWVIALVVLGAIGDRMVRFIPQGMQPQHAQLLPVPEITEEIDAPEAVVPEEPSEAVTPTPVPVQPSDVLREVQIEGPVDAIVGDPVYLRVRTEGPAINYSWSISPQVDGLFVLDDGSNAIFTNRNAQQYTVFVSAVDRDGNIEQDTYTFDLVKEKDTLTLQNLSEANPDPSIPELVDYYITEVRSPTKESEVVIVSQSFRQTANLLRTNAIGPGDNVLAKMQKGIEVSLGPQSFAAWEIFFVRLETLLSEYSAKGYLNTREAWINTLDNLAAVMESRGQRKLSLQK